MKGKTNKWLPWISSLLIVIIVVGLFSIISEFYYLPRTLAIYVPSPTPSTQLLGMSVIESINEFSGEDRQSYYLNGAQAGVTLSIILVFVVIPFLYVKGTIKSESRENPSPLWYVGSSLILMITILPIIIGGLKVYGHQNVEKSSATNREYDQMRKELMDVSFTVAEQVLELNEISGMSEIPFDNISEIKNSEYQYDVVTNAEDSSLAITISSEEVKDFNGTASIRPYSDQIYIFRRNFK